MHRLHGCTCRLAVAYTVRHASTATSMGCVTYFLTACSNSLTCQHLGRASVSVSVTICICIQLTLYKLLWPVQSSHGQCVSVWRRTCLQSSLRSYNELLCSRYSFMLCVIYMVSYSRVCVFYSFTVQYFNVEVVYINTLCF